MTTSEQFYTELSQLESRFSALAPELEVTVRDPALGVEGYVVVWNSAPGLKGPLGRCGKGGTRVASSLSLDEVKMLAQQMALKNAASGLPLGGAKSGLRADPSDPYLERKYRRFAQLVKPMLREQGGIFGGFGFDIGARPEFALWVCDELGSLGSFTGKPLHMGGTDYDREGIAGLGVAVGARELLRFFGERGPTKDAPTFAVQGMGAMGSAVYRYFTEFGGQPRFVSDIKLGGTVVLDHPPSPELSQAFVESRFEDAASLIAQEGFSVIGVDEVLYQQVDVLFPCALQDVLREDNVGRVQARYVVEGANSPCTLAAQRALHTQGVIVLPGYMVNSGGIIAAFVELSSELSLEENLHTRGNVHRAKALTEERIAANVHELLTLAQNASVEPVQAARYLALKRTLDPQ